MDLGISEAGWRIIDAVIDAPVAWRSPGELADRLGWDLERMLDEVADLDARGWLEAWELVDGPVVTLSTRASARCGVRLVEVGREATPRWARAGDPEPPGLPAVGVFRGQAQAVLNLVVDATLGPEDEAIRFEEVAARAGVRATDRGSARIDGLPRPTVLIGHGLTPWPGPTATAPGAACPACRSARLAVREYCLRCDRWGLDEALLAASGGRGKSRPPAWRLDNPRVDARRREAERKRRQAKRRDRRQAQARQLRLGFAAAQPSWQGPLAI